MMEALQAPIENDITDSLRLNNMRIYEEASQSPDEWFITRTLELEDDGRFSYYESWTCSLAGTGGTAKGRWRQSGDTVFLCTESVEGSMYLRFIPGQELETVEHGGVITLDGWTLS